MRTGGRPGLVKLLAAFVIVGILAAVAIPMLSARRERARYHALRVDLQNLVSKQEIYFSDHYRYAPDKTDEDLGFMESRGVTVTIVSADANGWAATAVHESMTGRGCAVFHGTAAPPRIGGAAPADPGAIVCTDD